MSITFFLLTMSNPNNHSSVLIEPYQSLAIDVGFFFKDEMCIKSISIEHNQFEKMYFHPIYEVCIIARETNRK